MMVLVDKFTFIFKDWLHLIKPSYDEPELIIQDEEEQETKISSASPYNLQQHMTT